MIKLQTGSVLIKQPDGDLEFLNLDQLHDVLTQCCLENGVDDLELPGDVLSVVSTFLSRRQHVLPEDIHQLIIRILCDSGLRLLAEAYARRVNSPETFERSDFISPDELEIQKLLSDEPFFVAKPVEQIATMVMAQLKHLKFSRCNQSFIIELARNAWFNLHHKQDNDSSEYWLLHRRDIQDYLKGETLRLHSLGILQIRSISALFPAIRCQVSLTALSQIYGQKVLTELQFYPSVDSICKSLLVVRGQLLDAMIERVPALKEEKINMQVHFVGMNIIIREYFNYNHQQENTLREDLQEIIEKRFSGCPIDWQIP